MYPYMYMRGKHELVGTIDRGEEKNKVLVASTRPDPQGIWLRARLFVRSVCWGPKVAPLTTYAFVDDFGT